MSINIPDKVYKLFVLIGVLLIGYSFYEIERIEKDYFEKIDKFDVIQDSLIVANFVRNYKLKSLGRISERISQKFSVDNPLVVEDSVYHFNRILIGNKEELIVSDSIDLLWEKIQLHKFKLDLLKKKESMASNRLDSAKELQESYSKVFEELSTTGFIVIFIGLLLWTIDALEEILRKTKTKKQFEKVYSHCQSCGKMFSPMLGYGKNKTKDYNYAFCENCFTKGKFTNEELSQEQVLATAKKNIGYKNWFYIKIMEYRLSKLERWKKNEY